jgi:PDZ domain-containing secreted protein
VYVVKVVAGGVSDGRLLTGDRIRAINGEAVDSYQQTQDLLKSSGSQVTINAQRKCSAKNAPTVALPPGECCPCGVWIL